MQALNQSSRSVPAEGGSLAPAAVVLLSTTGLILTAYLLGGHWLGVGLLGLPLGIWLIAGVFAAWRRGWLRLLDTAMPFAARRPRLDLSPVAVRRFAPLIRLWVGVSSPITRFARALWKVESVSMDSLVDGIDTDLDARPELADPIHIAIVSTRAQAEALRDHQSAVPVRWSLLEEIDERDRRVFDLVFRTDPEQGGLATLPEHERRPATWYDWATPRPLSFASVFPHQNDPAQFSVGVLPTVEDPDPLVGALLVAAGVSGRSRGRLTTLDRLRGRIPLDGVETPGTIDPGAFRARAMRRVSELLGACEPSRATVLERAAAGVLSAWLVTPSARIEMAERRAMMEQACLFLPDRPEAWLRLGAVRIADLDDAGGIEALLRGDPFVRATRDQLVLDQAEFVQSELEHGDGASMTLGRVAAGFCLLAAQHDYERLDFLKADLLEDLDHAGWLVGRDQDTAVLRGVFEELHRIRRAESRGLPGGVAEGRESRAA
jgi:hypothetical protein